MIHYLSSSIIDDRSIETKKRSLRKISAGVKKSDPVQFEIFAGAQPTTHPPGLAALGAAIVALIEPRKRGFADCTTSALLASTVSYTQRAPTTQASDTATDAQATMNADGADGVANPSYHRADLHKSIVPKIMYAEFVPKVLTISQEYV